MTSPSPQKLAEWQAKAALKDAIVPEYFEVFPNKVILLCGQCSKQFQRNLVPNVNEPTFVCPEKSCAARNWVPVYYDLS